MILLKLSPQLRTLIVIGVCFLVVILIFLLKKWYDDWMEKAETSEVEKDAQALIGGRGQTKNAMAGELHVRSDQNVAELREYYTISKRQARISFSAAMLACVLGFVIYIVGILKSYNPESGSTIAYSTIGGSIVEVVSGLFFWMYSKSLEQMNRYYDSLVQTQNQLNATTLAGQMEPQNRDSAYSYIITKYMDPDQEASIEVKENEAARTAAGKMDERSSTALENAQVNAQNQVEQQNAQSNDAASDAGSEENSDNSEA